MPPSGGAGGGDLDHGRADRPPHGPLDERHSLVVDQQRPGEHAHRRALVDAMLGRDRGLQLRQAALAFARPQAGKLAARLVDPGPIPSLPRRHVLPADVEALLAVSNLPLRPVQADIEVVLAIKKLDVFKGIALPAVRSRKGEQLPVAVQLRFPAGGQVAFEARAIEAAGVGQRTVGDDCAAAVDRGAAKPRFEPGDIADAVMRGFQRAEQLRVGIRPVGANAQPAGHPTGGG